jgi:two-component system KDP operon response regulator KdpE
VPTLLTVDDDIDFVRMIKQILEKEGYQVLTSTSSREALRLLYEKRPDLVLLDVNLPDSELNGFDICSRIREISDVPIIMLTAESEPEFIVEGFDAGADDYVTKPYNRDVLMARIKANLRRAQTPVAEDRIDMVYSDGYLSVNLEERRVTINNEQVKLSPTEFNMLSLLVQNAPRVVAYRDILQSVWGFEYADDIDYLRVYAWHLRRKIEQDPKNPIYIVNELGVGYRFERQI